MSRERPRWNNHIHSSFATESPKMTLEERRVIKSMESEAKRLGRFERIYPTKNSRQYRNFFDEERPLNAMAIDHINGKLNQ